MVPIKTLKDFPDYCTQICGYIRFSALSDTDYEEIIEKFQEQKLDTEKVQANSLYRYLHYLADLFLLKYYTNYKAGRKLEDTGNVKLKARYLYDRIHTCYPEFYEGLELSGYYVPHELPSHYKMIKWFKVLNDAGYPHQVLVFCYRSLIDHWSIERIIEELSNINLDEVFNNFVNEYSAQTELPVFVVNLYFLSMKEKLNKRLKNLILKNDSTMPVKMEEYLNWLTGWTMLEFYYGKDREHNISDWCNKVKSKAIKKLVAV